MKRIFADRDARRPIKIMLLRFTIFAALLLTMSVSNNFAQNDLPPIEKGVSQDLAKWRAANYSDVRYKLNLTIEKKAPTLKGSIEVNVNVKSDGRNATVKERVNNNRDSSATDNTLPNSRVSAIILDWRKIKGSEDLSKISNVSVNGKAAKFEESNEHLIFKDNIKTGENIIKLDFESPILTSGSAITRYIDKEDGAEYIYSLFVPSDASTAFPVFDQPDLKARFTLNITSPIEWKVISNSEQPLFTIHNGKYSKYGLKIFKETKPISTYVFAFAAGEFEEFSEKSRSEVIKKLEKEGNTFVIDGETVADDRRIRERSGSNIYVRKSQADKFKPHAEEVFRLNRESIKFLEDYFDYKFPFPKYDLVLIPEFPFGGMEHAGATFLRESSIIFPTEPTANNYISRAVLIFHENAHQWFGDTVTMKWFDDLWLKEGFATFMAYKTMEKVLPEYNAWKVFYERTKPLAYQTDVTRGTTPIYQEIPNLNSAKSAYGNIVYQKAPGFLRQAEFYLGEKEFQTAVRSFLKKHEFANAEWSDLVDSFEKSSGKDLKSWANGWVKQRGLAIFKVMREEKSNSVKITIKPKDVLNEGSLWKMKTMGLQKSGFSDEKPFEISFDNFNELFFLSGIDHGDYKLDYFFPNYQDYGYGIFLLDEKSKKYILANIQNEKDDFLRSMMWGSLWDSVRFAELPPLEYVELAIKNIGVETDVSTISSILARVDTAFTYYLSDAQAKEIAPKLESLLIDKMKTAKTQGERITFYRAFLGIASSENARNVLKEILAGKFEESGRNATIKERVKVDESETRSLTVALLPIKTKDKFDIVTKLIILGDKDAPKLLAELEKTETDDAAKRYLYAAKAGFATKENKAKYWNDFVNNKEIAENWIEEAAGVWNAPEHSEMTLPYLEKALAELPNHKQNRKIFSVNGWVASFIGGQESKEALAIVSKFLKDNPNLDVDLQRKILERLDGLERAVKIREKYGK